MTKTKKVYILDASKVRSYTDHLTRHALDHVYPNGSEMLHSIWNYYGGQLPASEIRQAIVEELHTAVYEMISCVIDRHLRKLNGDEVFDLQLNMHEAWKELV